MYPESRLRQPSESLSSSEPELVASVHNHGVGFRAAECSELVREGP